MFNKLSLKRFLKCKLTAITHQSLDGEWDWLKTKTIPVWWRNIYGEPIGFYKIMFSHFDEMMIAEHNGSIDQAYVYVFDPEKSMLELHGYEPNREGERYQVYECFRVEFPSPNVLYLYDREDDAPGRDPALFRMEFRRNIPCERELLK